MKKLQSYIKHQFDLATRYPDYAKTYMDLSYGAVAFYLYENGDKDFDKVSEYWEEYKAKFEKIIFNL